MKLSRTQLKRLKARMPKVKYIQCIVNRDGSVRKVKHYVSQIEQKDGRIASERWKRFMETVSNAEYIVRIDGMVIRDVRAL